MSVLGSPLRLRSGIWWPAEELATTILMAERKIDNLIAGKGNGCVALSDWLNEEQLENRDDREVQTTSGVTPDPHYYRGLFGRAYVYKAPRPHGASRGTGAFEGTAPSVGKIMAGTIGGGGSGTIDFFTRDTLLPRHTTQGDNYGLTRYQRSRIRHEAAQGGYRGTPEYLASKYGIPVRAIVKLCA